MKLAMPKDGGMINQHFGRSESLKMLKTAVIIMESTTNIIKNIKMVIG